MAKIKCPSCSAILNITRDMAGRRGECFNCKTKFQITPRKAQEEATTDNTSEVSTDSLIFAEEPAPDDFLERVRDLGMEPPPGCTRQMAAIMIYFGQDVQWYIEGFGKDLVTDDWSFFKLDGPDQRTLLKQIHAIPGFPERMCKFQSVDTQTLQKIDQRVIEIFRAVVLKVKR